MFKPTPNPPATPHARTIDPRIADEVLAHYDLRPEADSKPAPASIAATVPPPTSLNHEDTLLDLHSILQSAAATAYENADNQTGPNRKVDRPESQGRDGCGAPDRAGTVENGLTGAAGCGRQQLTMIGGGFAVSGEWLFAALECLNQRLLLRA